MNLEKISKINGEVTKEFIREFTAQNFKLSDAEIKLKLWENRKMSLDTVINFKKSMKGSQFWRNINAGMITRDEWSKSSMPLHKLLGLHNLNQDIDKSGVNTRHNTGGYTSTKSTIDENEILEMEAFVEELKSKFNTAKMGKEIVGVVKDYLESQEVINGINKKTQKYLDKNNIKPAVTSITLKKRGVKRKQIEKCHFKTPELLMCIEQRVPVALVGAAGSFKTSTVEMVAEKLGLKFYSKSVSAQTGSHEFFGFMQATGDYVPTLFRKAYQYGGVFLLDEFDAGNPNVLAALNQATANNKCPFPDKMVKKHKDFVMVMAGNTYGHGATVEYVGRNKIDAATLDRFAFIHFPYDENLEREICENKEWFETVLKYRKAAAEKGVKAIISPRATFMGEKLIAQGMELEKVKELLIFKGMNNQEKELLNSSIQHKGAVSDFQNDALPYLNSYL